MGRRTGWVALLCLTGCTGVDDALMSDGESWTIEVTAASEEALGMLYVVDPAQSDAGTAIRASAGVLARQQLDELRSHHVDPGVWLPAHWTVAVVDPTASGPERWGPPIELHTDRVTDADVEAFAEAIDTRVDGLVGVQGPYAPADAIADGLATLFGQRAGDPSEDAWKAAFDPGERPWGVVVNALTSRDGASPTATVTPPDDAVVMGAVVAPSSQQECAPPSPQVTLEPEPGGVLEVLDGVAGVEPAIVPWPCARASLEGGGHLFGYVDASPRSWCTSRPIRSDAGGRVACKMWVVDQPEDVACADHERGWQEPSPDDLAFVEAQSGATGRVCEVPQLDGGALEACRTDRTCEDCGHGWCQTTLDFDEPACGGVPARLRFVGRSLVGSGASFVIRCALEP